jgi:hypothetical protein
MCKNLEIFRSVLIANVDGKTSISEPESAFFKGIVSQDI